jgi:putative ABC transport system substrate-binding protein
MKRREFITLLGGAAAAWPLAARAQQAERVRRIGVLMNFSADDAEGQARLAAFRQGLQQAGWSVGGNIRIDYRWAADDAELFRKYAAELVALAPDVILASGNPSVAALQQATRSVPIVFAPIGDAVASGFVESLARPGGNITGFSAFEYSLSGKWLELLKELSPRVSRAAIVRDLGLPQGSGLLGAIQSVAPSLSVELSPINVGDTAAFERAVAAFARSTNGGLIVTTSPWAVAHRDLIIALAAQHHLPAVYAFRYFVTSGGLISYGPSSIDQFRRAAGYIDRILRGEKPADLPVQTPTKYELVINLKTARALGLEIPPTVLARADEVIE